MLQLALYKLRSHKFREEDFDEHVKHFMQNVYADISNVAGEFSQSGDLVAGRLMMMKQNQYRGHPTFDKMILWYQRLNINTLCRPLVF